MWRAAAAPRPARGLLAGDLAMSALTFSPAELGYMSPLPSLGSKQAKELPIAAAGEDGLSGAAGDGSLSWTFDHRDSGSSRDARNKKLDADGRAAAVVRAAGGQPPWTLRDFRMAQIIDARQLPANNSPSLDVQGFKFLSAPSSGFAQVGDFYDPDSVEADYYPEVEAALRREAGVDRVLVFDHITRNPTPPTGSASAADPRGYVTHVHCDYTEVGARRRAEQLLGADAAVEWDSGGRRLGILQLWRPIGPGPVLSNPLALLDASTVDDSEQIEVKLQCTCTRKLTSRSLLWQ